MSVSTLSSGQASAMGLIQGTGETQTQSVNDVLAQGQSAAQTQTVTDTLDQGAGTQALASPAAMSMSQLQNLAKSDPTRFKAVTQSISDQLATEGKTDTNAQQGKFLTDLSGKFAAASKSGSMSSLQMGEHHRGNGASGAGKYAGQHNSEMSGMFNQVGSIISSALANVGSTTAATSSTSSSNAVASVAASGGAEA